MNSKEVPPESSNSARRRRNNNNNAAANIRTVNRDFMNMFADLGLRDRRPGPPPGVASHHSNRVSNRNPRAPLPMAAPVMPSFPIVRPPITGFRYGEMREPWGRLRPTSHHNDMPPLVRPSLPALLPDIRSNLFAPNFQPWGDVEGRDPFARDDDVSYGSLPSLVTRVDSSDEESSDDEENEVMTYGSLPSLVTRSDSSDDEDDCSLPSLRSRPDSSDEEDSLPPLLHPLHRRRINHTSNVGRLAVDIRGIPPLDQREDSSDSDDDDDDDGDSDDDDDSDCSSDDSEESDGETYWEAAELEMETSVNYFDNEAMIDNGLGISSSQRRINRFSGSSTVRRNLSRVRCRCLARVSNNQAWIKLRDNMRVGRTVQ